MIPVFKPCYGDKEIEAVAEVLKSGWIGLGPRTAEFEKKFADYIGVKYAVAVNSCTAALHLALVALEIENSEVITTPMTFISTNHAIRYVNGIPVFADIYPDTLNIDPKSITNAITPATKAIIVVHYGGHACDMDVINEIAGHHNLYVIEDAAHGCGGEYKGRKIGSLGITKGTWQRDSANTGYSWSYDVEEVGYKCHMNDITAALGIVQLEKLDDMNDKRRALAAMYNDALADVDWIEIPTVMGYAKTACHNYVIKADDRNALNEFLKDKGISTGVHYIPSNHYEMYRHCWYETPVCENVWGRLLTLPLFPDLTDSEVDMIVDAVKGFRNES